MNFHIKSRGGGGGGVGSSGFELLAPEVHARKTYFPQCHIFVRSSCQQNLLSTISYLSQNFTWYIVPAIALARFRIVTRSYTASFSIKFI